MTTVTQRFLSAARFVRRPHTHLKRSLPGAFLQTVVAHRGLHDEAPENSMDAFRRAADYGLPIELDVRVTKDGELIVFHDWNTERLTGVDLQVADATWAELEPLRLEGTDQGIPRFAEVLREIDVPLLVELKSEVVEDVGLARRFVEVLAQHDVPRDRIAVESFNPLVLSRLKELDPSLVRIQLTATYRGAPMQLYKKWLLRYLWLNGQSRPDAVAVEKEMVSSRSVRRLHHDLGYGMVAWTAAGPADLDHLFQRGVQCVVADLTPGLIAHAASRGWMRS